MMPIRLPRVPHLLIAFLITSAILLGGHIGDRAGDPAGGRAGSAEQASHPAGTLLLPRGALAQSGFQCPEPGTLILPELLGADLQDAIRSAYRPPVGLGYAGARDVMFTIVDNEGGRVTGVYTGFTVSVDPASTDPRADAFAAGLNAEHTWPQSKGAEDLPMRADLHHLFPSEIDANNARGSFPFDEISDDETDLWYRLREVTTRPNPEIIDEYSELDRAFPGTNYEGRWEPRERQKGNVARAMFYFYTVYRAEANAGDSGFFGVQKDDLRAWHHADPVDEQEYERTCAIAPYQADRVNPFVIDPTLVDRAYFPETPVRLARFTARPTERGVMLEWMTAEDDDHAGFTVIRSEGGQETRLAEGIRSVGEGGESEALGMGSFGMGSSWMGSGSSARGTGLGRNYSFLDRTGSPGRQVAYWLEVVSRVGVLHRFGPQETRFPEVIPHLTLTPNPARAGEPILLQVDGTDSFAAEFYDLTGRRVAVRPAETGGETGTTWDGRFDTGREAVPGVYFVRVRTGRGWTTARLVLLR